MGSLTAEVSQRDGVKFQLTVEDYSLLVEPLRYRRRCLEHSVSHLIGHTYILVVANACKYGQRHLRYGSGDLVGVEALQVACRATSTNNCYNVELVGSCLNYVKCRFDTLLATVALHYRLEKLSLNAVGTACQLHHKILVACGCGARNYRHSLYYGRHQRLTIQLVNALRLQSLDCLLSATLHLAYGKTCINLQNLQRYAVDCVVRNRSIEENLHSLFKLQPALLLESADDTRHLRTPNSSSCLCLGSTRLTLLNKVDIAVSRCVLL